MLLTIKTLHRGNPGLPGTRQLVVSAAMLEFAEVTSGAAVWLRRAATARPSARAYTFLADGETESAVLTYGELATRVRAVATHLTSSGLTQEPVLLVFPAGLDFIVALLGCLEAGAIAVPVAVPRARRDEPVLTRLATETGARLALSTAALRDRFTAAQAPDVELRWEDVTAIGGAESAAPFTGGEPPAWPAETPAIIQYTSGSTADPKGVVITHGNLAANEASIAAVMGHGPDLVGVGWLPHFHDMGLVGNILQTLAMGGHLVLMPPAAMVQSPHRWLRAISHYRATTSGGPNFAFDWCVQKVRPEHCADLDLSRWRVAFVGAEPVHAATLERFAAKFAPYGFRSAAWLPCYGLAEATLMVTGARGLHATTVDGTALQTQRWVPCAASHPHARRVVSCGPAAPGVEVVVRSATTGGVAAPGEVGEILAAGPGIATGYWDNAEATTARFAVAVIGRRERFLATGDLGVWTDQGLHVLGRSREMIIVRGHNLFPEDIEFTAQAADAALMPGGVAAFGIEIDSSEAVVIVAEVQRGALAELAPEATARRVAVAVAESHGVTPHEVVLLRPGRVSRTTSGKVQRGANRTAYLDGQLESLFSFQPNVSQPTTLDPTTLTRAQLLAAPAARRQRLVVARLKAQVARLSGCDPLELEADQDLLALGLDSVQLLEIKVGLDELAGRELPLDAFLDAKTLGGLAEKVIALGGFGETNTLAPAATPVVEASRATPDASAAPMRCPFGHGASDASAQAPRVPAHDSSPTLSSPTPGRRAPGPTPAEIEAEIAQLSRDFPGYLLDLTRRHGEIVRLVLGQQEIHLITHPEDLGTVFMTQSDIWLRRGVWAPFRPVMGMHGLITTEGPTWKSERSFANPEFNRAAVARDRADLEATVSRAIATWTKPEPLPLLSAAKHLTLEIILRKLFGSLVKPSECDELYPAVADIDRLWNVPAFFLYAGRGNNRLAEEHEREVARRVAVIDRWMNVWLDRVRADPNAATGVMAHYVRNANGTTATELRDVAVTYLLTGFDTTASGIYWTIALLLENDSARQRLQSDLAAVPLGADLPWTLAVTQEALRLYPPVWYMGREATVDTTLRGCAIPAGSFAIASPYVVHRNPWCWPDPLAYRPERFLSGATTPIPAKAYMPFGLGARMCIGMHFALAEIATAVAELFSRYDVERTAGEWRGLCSDFTLTPRAPLNVRIVPKAAR